MALDGGDTVCVIDHVSDPIRGSSVVQRVAAYAPCPYLFRWSPSPSEEVLAILPVIDGAFNAILELELPLGINLVVRW